MTALPLVPGVARELGVSVGDKIKLISPNGVKTAFGTSPRVNAYEVVSMSSPPGAGTSTAPACTCRLPRRRGYLQPRRRGG